VVVFRLCVVGFCVGEVYGVVVWLCVVRVGACVGGCGVVVVIVRVEALSVVNVLASDQWGTGVESRDLSRADGGATCQRLSARWVALSNGGQG
jgi:hypothetical protein